MNTLYSTLISADELRALLASGGKPVIVDARFELSDVEAGEKSFREAHLPGSDYLHLDRHLSGAKTGRNGRHPLPSRETFAVTLGRLGITPQTQVVALDRQGGVYASRLWWMLRWMGHRAAAVLDGGIDAWTQSGGSLVAGETPPPGEAPPYPQSAPLASSMEAATLATRLGAVRLIDARAPERFRGEVEPLDTAAGHIPGALNRFFKDNLSADGRFKSSETLHAEFAALLGAEPPSNAVHQCGSGVTACHNLLAMEHAGLHGSALYPGSWSEWSSDPSRPLAKG